MTSDVQSGIELIHHSLDPEDGLPAGAIEATLVVNDGCLWADANTGESFLTVWSSVGLVLSRSGPQALRSATMGPRLSSTDRKHSWARNWFSVVTLWRRNHPRSET